MDQVLIRKTADDLCKVLTHHAVYDAEARNLLGALSNLIKLAREGSITVPLELEAVPGAYYFTEGGLRRYRDVEEAYAAFKIEVTGGESPVLRALRARHPKNP